jgi:glycosyltransferase involved in cell wall biosynthesis
VPVSVVVPVYNSAPTLDELVTRLAQTFSTLEQKYEVVLVNDGSADNSWDTCADLANERREVRAVNLARNSGQHNALLAGIRAARHDVIVTLDDDLQNPPEEIGKLLAKLDEGYDVVYGTPTRRQQGFWRRVAARVTRLALGTTMGAETARRVSSFRAFRAPVRDAFGDYSGPSVFIDVLLTWGTTKFGSVPVVHEPRSVGHSNYSFRKLVSTALNMATGFSTRPLQLASLVGFTFALFGMGILGYVVVRRILSGYKVPGFAFLASITAIFSGAQLFALGIIGEYLARLHFRSMGKPTYIVREVRD